MDLVQDLKKEVEKLKGMMAKDKGKKVAKKKKDDGKEEEKEDGQLDKSDSDEDEGDEEEHWADRIRKQNTKDWTAMMKHVKRGVKDMPQAQNMFKVFQHKYDANQTIYVLRQRLCCIALERGHKGGVF